MISVILNSCKSLPKSATLAHFQGQIIKIWFFYILKMKVIYYNSNIFAVWISMWLNFALVTLMLCFLPVFELRSEVTEPRWHSRTVQVQLFDIVLAPPPPPTWLSLGQGQVAWVEETKRWMWSCLTIATQSPGPLILMLATLVLFACFSCRSRLAPPP